MKKSNLMILLVGILTLAACQANRPKPTVQDTQVSSLPIKNVTSFDAALSCMDEELSYLTGKDLLVTSAEIKNKSGETKGIPASATEMLMGAIARMGETSGRLRYLENAVQSNELATEVAHSEQDAIVRLEKNTAKYAPRIAIKGVISQFNKDGVAQGNSAGLGIKDNFMFQSSDGEALTTIALDLRMVQLFGKDYSSPEIVPGMVSRNVMPVYSSEENTELGVGIVKLAKIGLEFNYSRSEGIGSAVRSLVELGTIELIGKYYGIPYEDCLADITKERPITIDYELIRLSSTNNFKLIFNVEKKGDDTMLCYYQEGLSKGKDENRIAQKYESEYNISQEQAILVYPNRFSAAHRGLTVTIPDTNKFTLLHDTNVDLACLSGVADLSPYLPDAAMGKDLEKLNVTLDEIVNSAVIKSNGEVDIGRRRVYHRGEIR